jgi:hypothetical protein
MKHVVLRGKGGGGGPSGNEVGSSDFLQVSLPFKQNGQILIKKFVVGWYVCQMNSASASVTQPEDQARETFRLEIHAEPIRLALKTW